MRASFYWYTGELPQVAPRDYAACRAIVAKLQQARHKCAPLTKSEHSRLTKLINRWEHRASGLDQRFNVVGTKPGALTIHETDRLTRLGWTPRSTK